MKLDYERLIVCPVCLARLCPTANSSLVCRHRECRRSYAIRPTGAPELLQDRATILDEAAWRAALDAAGSSPESPRETRTPSY